MAVRDNMVFGPLRNVSILYKNENYIAEEIFPSLIVSPRSQLTVYNHGDWFRDEAQVRAPGTSAVRGNPTSTYVQVTTQKWAFASEATDEDRDEVAYTNAPPLEPDQDAIQFATEKILLRKEVLVSNAICGSQTVWNGETGGEDCNALWAAGANNTFIEDIHAGINTMIQNTGHRPNRLLLSYNTFSQLQQESTLLSRVQYSSLGIITTELIAKLFGLDKVFVATTIYNSEDEELTDSHTGGYLFEQTAGKGSAFLYYYNSRVGKKIKNSGYLCTLPRNGTNRAVYKFREDDRHTDIYEASEEFSVETSHAPDLGKLYVDTIVT